MVFVEVSCPHHRRKPPTARVGAVLTGRFCSRFTSARGSCLPARSFGDVRFARDFVARFFRDSLRSSRSSRLPFTARSFGDAHYVRVSCSPLAHPETLTSFASPARCGPRPRLPSVAARSLRSLRRFGSRPVGPFRIPTRMVVGCLLASRPSVARSGTVYIAAVSAGLSNVHK